MDVHRQRHARRNGTGPRYIFQSGERSRSINIRSSPFRSSHPKSSKAALDPHTQSSPEMAPWQLNTVNVNIIFNPLCYQHMHEINVAVAIHVAVNGFVWLHCWINIITCTVPGVLIKILYVRPISFEIYRAIARTSSISKLILTRCSVPQRQKCSVEHALLMNMMNIHHEPPCCLLHFHGALNMNSIRFLHFSVLTIIIRCVV